MLAEAIAIEPPASVIIIDDDPDEREGIMDELRDYKIEPIPLCGPYGSNLERIVKDVMENDGTFVVCDHRLQSKNFASFNGSTVVKALSTVNKPAMLLTMFQSTNRLELREARSDLPVVVNRDDFEAERLGEYAKVCQRELDNNPVDERRSHRTLISVIEIAGKWPTEQLLVRIPSWRAETAILLPSQCVSCEVMKSLRAGDYLLGDVNIGAENEDDLFFRNVNERHVL